MEFVNQIWWMMCQREYWFGWCMGVMMLPGVVLYVSVLSVGVVELAKLRQRRKSK